ncbi:hypothetical protein SCAR479_06981 [Seiridium cardinale]|uniref:Uncharacterized protein n=1 Tax=Seiridium cardinale TaxID=138064 RepID=A0ABR2XRE9_9PEZI
MESPPKAITSEVIDATIVTRHPPDIDRNALIVGLCAVPVGREGKNDLGHHVADFLAWKALCSGPWANTNHQVWLSQLDLVDAHRKHSYSHGGRDMGSAVGDTTHPIIVEPNARALAGKFMRAVLEKSQEAKELNDPLVVFVCGLTSLEQDIFIVEGDDYAALITSESIRAAIGRSFQVIFVTPSVTSTGWQVNPSFMYPTVTLADSVQFMARQCGAIFGADIAQTFYREDSPVLLEKTNDAFSVPVKKDSDLKATEAEFHNKIHTQLASRFVTNSGNHSFSFEADNDPWKLIGVRTGIPLAKLAAQWGKLDKIDLSLATASGFQFLGSAFGANRKSQLVHMIHTTTPDNLPGILEEGIANQGAVVFKHTLNSPGYHSSNYRQIREHFDSLKHDAEQNEVKCRVLFNALEHRMSLIVLGDLITRFFGLSSDMNTRCRDWNEGRWVELAKNYDKKFINDAWASILNCIPPICMPYDRNIDLPKGLFISLSGPTRYIATALGIHSTKPDNERDETVTQICKLLHRIKAHQVKLLCADPEVKELGNAWKDSCINNGMKLPSGAVPQTSLSALAKPFVPGTRFAPPTPLVIVEPPSPDKQINSTATQSPSSTANTLVQSPEKENIAPTESAAAVEELESKAEDAVRPSNLVGKDNDIGRAVKVSSEPAGGGGDEDHLLPHLRTRLRPLQVARPTTPVEPVGPASTTPSTPRRSASDVRNVHLANGATVERRSTPPHLRSPRTPVTIASIKYR